MYASASMLVDAYKNFIIHFVFPPSFIIFAKRSVSQVKTQDYGQIYSI